MPWYRHSKLERRFPLLLAFILTSGCKKEDQKECTQALLDGRSAVRSGDVANAEAQLARAATACDARRQVYVEQLRQELAAKQAKLEALSRAESEIARAQSDRPVRALVEWVERQRSSADKREPGTECFDRASPRFGWCETQKPGPATAEFFSIHHSADSEAFRYSAKLPGRAVCDDLDSHRVVRRWETKIDGERAERVHCEFLSKRLRGLSGLITTVNEVSNVDIFSREYLNRDGSFRTALEREGR